MNFCHRRYVEQRKKNIPILCLSLSILTLCLSLFQIGTERVYLSVQKGGSECTFQSFASCWKLITIDLHSFSLLFLIPSIPFFLHYFFLFLLFLLFLWFLPLIYLFPSFLLKCFPIHWLQQWCWMTCFMTDEKKK